VNRGIRNHGLKRNVRNRLIEGSRLNICLQEPNEVNEDNSSNVRREASKHFWNKKRQYLKDKINELESNSKNKNIRDLYRGINEFKSSYQLRTKLLKV
jgi:hypothetical protein